MDGKAFQNGCVALGGFIALACRVHWLAVFIFALLFWKND